MREDEKKRGRKQRVTFHSSHVEFVKKQTVRTFTVNCMFQNQSTAVRWQALKPRWFP
jgi:hypothetical protein